MALKAGADRKKRDKGSLPMSDEVAQWTTEEFKLLNTIMRAGQPEMRKSQNQNLPMKEKQKNHGTSQGLPSVGVWTLETLRKEPRCSAPLLTRFQNHLVLESKPHFRIILRLENASPC
jgi:hypothetical protein